MSVFNLVLSRRLACSIWFSVAACVPASWIPSERKDPPTAQPTEVVPDTIIEKRARSKLRKDWIKERHRAAPGVDWAAVERQNGRDRIARRSLLAQAPPPGGAPDDGDRWTERGSENQAGRTHVARPSPDGVSLYVGAAAGGLWLRGADESWTPLGDGLFGGVHWLEVFPDLLVTGTDGGYLYRSEDGGQSWQEGSGLAPAWTQRRLTVTTDGKDTLYAVRGNSDGYTVWRSDDHAANWVQVADLDDFAGDVFVARTGGGTVWLAAKEGLRRSDDQGESWATVGAWPAAESADLAACEAWDAAGGAPRFYVVQDGETLLRSDDGGATFAAVGALTDYWGVLTASTVDAQQVVYGGVEVHKSGDGGVSFAIQSPWDAYYDDPENRLHADVMGIDVVPDGAGTERWYLNTDGGTYLSTDGLDTVKNLSLRGLRVSQYYGTVTSTVNADHVAAGSQDQGYQSANGQPVTGHLYDFDQLLSGDYGHLTSGDGTHEIVYSVYPDFVLIAVGEDEPQLTYADFPADARSYAWLPLIVADPANPEAAYFGGDRLWIYERTRKWEWTPRLYSEQDFTSVRGEYVSGLSFAPGDHERAYVVTSVGRVFRSEDRGLTWTPGATALPAGGYYYGTAIVASARDNDTVYIGGSGYSTAPLWVSHDGGDTFAELSDGLPATLVYSLVEEPTSGVLFAGTETSAWRLVPGSSTWEDITGVEAPLVVYWSAEIVPAAGIVRFGTYGRGVWDYAYDADLDGCVDEVDADGDGALCELDCNDNDGSIHPSAADVCGDGLDQDCDGGDTTCPEDTGAGATGGNGAVELSSPRCGCAANGGGGAGMLLLVSALVVRRRLPRRARLR